jgi:exonuclease VII large subunit
MALLNLRQTCSIEEYKRQFDKLVYHIRLYDQSISKMMMVSQIMLGLKDELRHTIEMQLPQSVAQAATLAEIQEHLNEKKPYQRKYVVVKPDSKSSFSNTELWKARQLKEYRRSNNLCFTCGEKYTPTHTCSATQVL